jgi:rhodanese-related sulfurtransferase/dienelactone hydrolase
VETAPQAGAPAAGESQTGVTVEVNGGSFTRVTPEQLAAMLEKKDFYFVNTHIPYEGEIDATDALIAYDETLQQLDQYPADKDAKIVLYCRSDRMSTIAAEELVAQGYTNIWELDGGMVAWEAAGFELIEKPQPDPQPAAGHEEPAENQPAATQEVEMVPVAPEQVTGQPVTFETPDGATLQGTLYGSGTTAVIFSTMSDSKQDTWLDAAQAAARRGYLALTFNFRFWTESGRIDDGLRGKAAEDIRAAAAFVREQGAERVVLVGASLGGMASAKVAAADEVTALVVIAAPLDWPDWPEIRVTEGDIQAIEEPVLFINSEGDLFADDTRNMYEAAAGPKELQIYPGDAHGTDLFDTAHAAEVMERILAFLESQAPAR